MNNRSLVCVLALISGVAPQRFGPFGPGVPAAASGCGLVIPGSRSNICITYDDVNQAFEEALRKVGLPPVNGRFDSEEVGHLGTVIQETSRILALQYQLSKDAIYNGLPLIDTTKTVIENYCPSFLKPPKCKIERYRSITGACNNLNHPLWGAAMTSNIRFIDPDFADGISAPRQSVTGKPLPLPRYISSSVHTDDGFHDHAITIMLVAWGQFMDHDITLSAESKDPKTGKAPDCCQKRNSHPNCLPIEIPSDDSFYSKHNQRCMNFARSEAGLNVNCKLGPRANFNILSSLLDGGTVYGNSEELLTQLRSFKNGLLSILPVFDEFNMKPLLPLKLESPNEGCIRPSEDVYCFLAGDARVNEQTVLATIHLVMVRNHNKLAEELQRINPHWTDETLFQEARHINVAIIQHITYNEFLPMVLGKEVMSNHGLILLKQGYLDDYNPELNPSANVAFNTAAFRFGHTLLPSSIERWSKTHRYVGSQKLSEMLQQPYDLYKAGWIDNYLMGMINQVAQAYDNSITGEVTNHLFQEPGKNFGMDLISLNLERGRENGLPSYIKFREFCGFPKVRSWDDLAGVFNNQTLAGYRRFYASYEDIDLWSAGVSERPLRGSLMGPTFSCLLGKQFNSLKLGDRFWYENGGWPSSFTIEQLNEIRKIKLSRLICDNTDSMDSIQVYSMVLPDHEINPRVPCKSGILPSIDLTKWRDASVSDNGLGPTGFGLFK